MGIVSQFFTAADTPQKFDDFFKRSSQLILGKEHELRLALACLLARGHLLIEDLPGMGKTTLVMVLAKLLGLSLRRVQFTNDILPADILGTNLYDPQTKKFDFHPGPIFAELVLADELNRATPKTQSACLQAMEERSVTIDGTTHALPDPFFLIATQNPMDQAGTYPLPESQLDRFTMRISLGAPSKNAEIEILRQGDSRTRVENETPILSKAELLKRQLEAQKVFVSDSLLTYVQDILGTSRRIAKKGGLSPRAGLLLLNAARAWAYLEGRSMVLPDDVKSVAKAVLSHRLTEGQLNRLSSGDELVEVILSQVKVP